MKTGKLLKGNKQPIIHKKAIQKAYFLDTSFEKEVKEEKHQNGFNKDVLSKDFCKVIGNILTFVEKADQEL